MVQPTDRPRPRAGAWGRDLLRRVAGAPDGIRAAYARSEWRRVWLFTGLLALIAAGGYWTIVRHLEPLQAPFHPPWPLLAAGFFAAEAKVIVVHFRRESHSFSLSEIPAVAGLFFFTPDEYMASVLVGSAAAMLLTSRVSAVKLAFNTANFAVIAVVDLAVFHAFRAQPLLDVAQDLVTHRRAHRARRHCVHADAGRAHFLRQRLGERDHAALGRRVADKVGIAGPTRVAGDIDDHAIA